MLPLVLSLISVAVARPHNGHPSQSPMWPATINIDPSTRYQTIDGFGFSEAFQRSSQLHGGFGLSPENQTRVLDYLFSNTTGMGATILRNGIGSSVDSSHDFMNSIEPVSPGSPSAPPQYQWDGNDTDQLWLSKVAQSYGVKTFYADAWSAPGFMKTNGNDSNGGSICGVTDTDCATGDWRQAYANYLAQFVKFYQQEGVKITHLGFLNEPDLNQTYASMQSSGTQAADFLKVLYPTLQEQGMGDIQIACCENTGWSDTITDLTEIQLAGAEDMLGIVTSHGYSSDPKAPLNTNKKVWQTEWADLNGRWNPRWDYLGKAGEGIAWANKVQDAMVLSNLSGWLYWQGAENSTMNSMLIRLGRDDFEVSKRLWGLGQFSRFVLPGAVRIGAQVSGLPSGENGNLLYTSAFENLDGSVAIVSINNGHADLNVQLNYPGTAEMWATSEQYSIDNLGNVEGEAVVPKRTMVTWVFR